MTAHHKLNYVEFAAKDLEATKAFFNQAFGWEFQDYGPDYASMTNAGVDGGFYRAALKVTTEATGALVVLFSDNLEASMVTVEEHGGVITEQIFAFPGGRRFHFLEPSGNEFAIWGH